MALIAWYPLNGDTKDYSGNGNDGTGHNILYNNGKIGQAAEFDDTFRYISIADSNLFELKSEVSLCAWIKMPNYASDKYPTIVAKGVTFGGTQSYSLAITNAGNLFFEYSNQNGQRRNVIYNLNNNYPTNTWLHLVGSHKSGNYSRLYINGVKVNEVSRPEESILTTSRNITISDNSGARYFNGLINDVRIYDHALSEKEIKEIAKAKVLHYTFNDFQEPTENLVEDPTFKNGVSSNLWRIHNSSMQPSTNDEHAIVSGRGSTTQIHGGIYYDFYNVVEGESYTFSIRFKVLEGQEQNRISLISTQNLSAISNFLNNTPVSTSGIEVDTDVWNTLTVTGTVIQAGELTRFRFYLQCDFDNSINTIFAIKYTQVERKPHATPFTPNTRPGTVLDSSGYDNHAELALTTTPRWIEDSKVGSGAYEFDNKRIATPPFIVANKTLTLAAWVKPTGTHTSDRGIVIQQNANYYLTVDTAQRVSVYWYSTSPAGYHTTSETLALNEWSHIATTWDGSYNRIYINGSLVKETPVTGDGRASAGHPITIGRETTNRAFVGQIDDPRIYTTALSGSDIKELYRVRASLDDAGNLTLSSINEHFHLWHNDIHNFNLAENGSQEYKSNYNWTAFEYDSVLDCFRRQSGSSTPLQNSYIPINGNELDSWDQYRLQGEVKGEVEQSRYYFMIVCYDRNFRMIRNQDVNATANTTTVLAQDLVSGDEWVYLENITNWFDDGTTNYHHAKGLALWHPDDVTPYDVYKYTKRWRAVNEVDKVNNRLRLRGPYSGETIPAGSPAQNHRSGGTYSYIAASNPLTNLDEWVFHSANTTTTPNVNNMRYGTSYIRVGFLMNRNATTQATTLVKNIKFYNLDTQQRVPSVLDKTRITPKGLYESSNFSEIGPAKGLIAWYPLNKDTEDYTMHENNGINHGAILTSGLNGGAYRFSNDSDFIETSLVLNYNSDFTVSAWIKRDAVDNWCRMVDMSRQDYPGLIGVHSNNSGFFGYRLLDGSVRATYYSINNYADQLEWFHVAIIKVKNSTEDWPRRLAYVNGTLSGSTLLTDIDEEYSGNLIIGGQGTRSHYGAISDVRIYNRALTAEEVGILYDLTCKDPIAMKQTSNTLYLSGKIKER